MKSYLAIVVLALAVSCISAQSVSVSGGLGNLLSTDSIRNTLKATSRSYITPIVNSSPMGPFIRFGLSFAGMSDWLESTTWTGTQTEAMLRNTMDSVNGMIGGYIMG